MSRRSDRNLVVALDIGSSKIAVLVGECAPGEPVELIGIGTQASRGIKRGGVVDMDSTVQSIQRAIEEAELMAGCEIRSVYASITGSHIQGRNSHGIVAIRDNEVTRGDLDRVLDAARAVAIPADRTVLHVLPQDYVIDEQEGIRNPLGMSGVRLEARVHLVTAAASAAQNLSKCVARGGLEIDALILQPLAAAQAVLSEDEKDLGVCLIDIGAGTTDVAVFVQGSLRHTAVLPVAGDHVTNDIAHALRTPTQHAEEIKVRYACALAKLATAEESIQVPGVGDRPARRMARQTLADWVQKRYEDIFEMVHAELRRSGFENLIGAGVVLTGGAARMEGAVELAEEMLNMPVRLGIPGGVTGLSDVVTNPIHAAGVGLLRHAAAEEPAPRRSVVASAAGTRLRQWLERGRSWFRGEF